MKNTIYVFRAILLLMLFFLLPRPDANAAPYLGGEIRWECLPNGNFRFIMVVYRECAWGHTGHTHQDLATNAPVGPITLYMAERHDISPVCNPDTMFDHLDCAETQPGLMYANTGTVEMLVYTSDSIHPNGVQINGTPPPSGWYFTSLDSWCCRLGGTNLSNYSTSPIKLRAVMRPYKNKSLYPCYDNSPVFAAPPQTVVCAGYPTSISQYTYDADLDKLSYSWALPVDDNGTPLTYNPGYSVQQPLPGPFHHPGNTGVTMDNESGLTSFTSYTTGAFVYVQKISAMREGVVISETYREFQIVVDSCGPGNEPPFVFLDNAPVSDSVLIIEKNVSVGELLDLDLLSWDTLPSTLANGHLQRITLTAEGQEFGQNYITDTVGCPITPCATLGTPLPRSDTMPQSLQLTWPVGIDHFIGLNNQPLGRKASTDFIFHFSDDHCSIPMQRNLLLRVNIDLDSQIDLPGMHCISSDTSGVVHIQWDTIGDPLGLFRCYKLYTSASPSGPFILIDSITDPNTTTASHPVPGSTQNRYYQLVVGMEYTNGTEFEVVSFLTKTLGLEFPNTPCAGDTFMVEVVRSGNAYDSIWVGIDHGALIGQQGDSLWFRVDTAGVWELRVHEMNSCGYSIASKALQVKPSPVPHLIGQKYACPGLPVQLTAAPGALSYLWTNGSTQQSAVFPPQQHTFYVGLHITGANQCKGSAIFEIQLVEPYQGESLCMINVNPQNGRPEVIWEKTDDAYTREYEMEYASSLDPGNWNYLGNTQFSSPAQYTDNLNNPISAQLLYRIRVIDSCNNPSSWSDVSSHFFLKANNSGNNVYVSWLPPQGVVYDKIYLFRSLNGGSFVLLDSIQNNISFVDVAPPPGNLEYRAEIHGLHCDPGSGQVQEVLYSNVATPENPGFEEIADASSVNIVYDGENGFWIECNTHDLQITKLEIYSILGEQLRMEAISPFTGILHKSYPNLSPGIYLCIVRTDSGLSRAGKFIVR